MINDGIEVVLDIFDLKEGHDKYSFMERMVTDPDITHVLVISDKMYSQKADARKAGVGTESQIISREVYEKVQQSKFIPVVCEFSEGREPLLPTFLKGRMWIDFSSLESVNENWEQLVQAIYGKPIHQKPQLGRPPAYIIDGSASPSSPAIAKYSTFKQAFLQNRNGISVYRDDSLSACTEYADALRVRKDPGSIPLGEKILEDCGKLKQVRNQIAVWVLLESSSVQKEAFTNSLLELLERLRELKSRPREINAWHDAWFDAHSLFVYETFLYIVAALLKSNAYEVLHEVFTSHYLRPETERYSSWGQSGILQAVLASPGKRLLSPAAELMRKQADRMDIPFASIIEAEAVALLMALVTPAAHWYPQTLFYSSQSEFPFFIRATQHKYFLKLAAITGIFTADGLREAVREGHKRLGVAQWYAFSMRLSNFWNLMNMDKLDSLK